MDYFQLPFVFHGMYEQVKLSKLNSHETSRKKGVSHIVSDSS